MVAGLLLVAALAGGILWQAGQPQRQAQTMPAWRSPAIDAVAAITIRGPEMPKLQLTRRHGTWIVNGNAKADVEAVRHLLDDLHDMQPVRMVTDGHTHDAELGLGRRAVVVTLADAAGRRIDALEIGKQGTDLVTSYVRRTGAPVVMAMDRALLWQVKRTSGAWQAKADTKHTPGLASDHIPKPESAPSRQ